VDRPVTRRGIEPALLVSQVRTGAPYVLATDWDAAPERAYLRYLKEYDGRELDVVAYFKLCLSAHWATAGCFVPTDVDNTIRYKLWKLEGAAPDERLAMADAVIASLAWDYSPVTARVARHQGEAVATHEGTWFSVAAGAYAALKDEAPGKAAEVMEAAMTEARREASLFERMYKSGSPLETLKATALLAHNFGDFDRVIDQWELPEDDALRRAVYDAAKPGSRLFGGWPALAGEINKACMAPENHRHLALREARGLRRKSSLLLPVGPFYDDWGAAVAGEAPEDVGEAVRALVDGWERQKVKAAGYPRGLAGILERFPGGLSRLAGFIPAKDERLLRAGALRAAIDVPRARFEAQWANLLKRAQLALAR
jgi:hypothetical protein